MPSKRVRPEAFGESEFEFGAVDGESRLQSSRVRTGQATEIIKGKSELRQKRLKQQVKMVSKGGKGCPARIPKKMK